MKFRAFGILPVAFGLALAGCVPAANNTEKPNALVANPRTLNITRSAPSTTTVALNCGCRYKLTVTGYSGDTADILYAPVEPLDSMSTQHHLTFSASPTAPTGTHTAALALFYPDDNGLKFYDTVSVTLIVP